MASSRDQSELAFTTPFIPRDYNKYTYAFEFSKDFMAGDAADNNSTEDGSILSDRQPEP